MSPKTTVMKKNVLFNFRPKVSLRMRILAEPKGYLIFLKLPIGSYNDYQAEVSPVPA
jgi:hypothetical protein